MTEFARPKEIIIRPPLSIGIAGQEHATGSTAVSRGLAQILGFRHYNAGEVFRRVVRRYGTAEDKDKQLIQLTSKPSYHPRVDRHIGQAALLGGAVFEGKAIVPLIKAGFMPTRTGELSRIGPNPVKIFSILLTCDPRESALRALIRDYCEQRKIDNLSEEQSLSLKKSFSEEAVQEKLRLLNERIQQGRQQWNSLYNLSQIEKEEGGFDLTIDSTHIGRDEIIKIILSELIRSGLLTSSLTKAYQAATGFINAN